MSRLVVLALVITRLAFSQSTLFAEDWPQWRGPHRNGQISRAVPFGTDVKFVPLWEAQLGTGFSSIVIAGDRVLSAGNTDNEDSIWCLKVEDGSVLWKHTYPAPLDPNLFEGGPTATPTVVGQDVFLISRTGEIYCLNLQSGEVRWLIQVPEDQRKNTPSWGFSSSPLVIGERVYFNTGGTGLCLDIRNGEVIWRSEHAEMAGYTSPLIMQSADKQLLLVETEKSLLAADPEDGKLLWSTPWITRYGINAADPLVINDHQLVVTSGYAKGASLLEISSEGAKEVWRIRDLRTQMSPGVVIDGYIYANDGDADRDCKLVCVKVDTGKVNWLERGFGSCSLIAVGGQLLLLSESGELVVVNAISSKLDVVARSSILSGKCWTPPAYANSRVFARNAEGKLVCIELTQ